MSLELCTTGPELNEVFLYVIYDNVVLFNILINIPILVLYI